MKVLDYVCRQCCLRYGEVWENPKPNHRIGVCPRCGDFNEPEGVTDVTDEGFVSEGSS